MICVTSTRAFAPRVDNEPERQYPETEVAENHALSGPNLRLR